MSIKKLAMLTISLCTCLFMPLVCLDQKKELPLVVLIPSFNNKAWYKRNLDTVFYQNYENYRVIYIDDYSTDGTADLVEKYVKECGQQHRFTLIKNKTRVRAMANLYRGFQLCGDDEIILTYDGDDWFAHEHVFELINDVYQQRNEKGVDVWLTYGFFKNWPSGKLGYLKPVTDQMVENQLYRKKWWAPGQLRTFYGWLAKQIKLKDLIFTGPYFQGQFFPANYDLAIYYPMMEMAGYHFKRIDEPIYVRNVQTELNDFKVNKEVQVLGSHIIRTQKELYPKVHNNLSGYFDTFKKSQADIVIFSADKPKQLEQLLVSIEQFVYSQGNVVVVYYAQDEYQQAKYQQLELVFDNVEFVQYAGDSNMSLSSLLGLVLTRLENKHLLFMFDGMVFNQFIDLQWCIEKLERTFAYCFMLGLDKNRDVSNFTGHIQRMPPFFQLEDNLFGWMIGFGQNDWRVYHTISGALYRTNDVLRIIQKSVFNTPQQFAAYWQQYTIDLEHVALCFDKPKIGMAHWSMPVY